MRIIIRKGQLVNYTENEICIKLIEVKVIDEIDPLPYYIFKAYENINFEYAEPVMMQYFENRFFNLRSRLPSSVTME